MSDLFAQITAQALSLGMAMRPRPRSRFEQVPQPVAPFAIADAAFSNDHAAFSNDQADGNERLPEPSAAGTSAIIAIPEEEILVQPPGAFVVLAEAAGLPIDRDQLRPQTVGVSREDPPAVTEQANALPSDPDAAEPASAPTEAFRTMFEIADMAEPVAPPQPELSPRRAAPPPALTVSYAKPEETTKVGSRPALDSEPATEAADDREVSSNLTKRSGQPPASQMPPTFPVRLEQSEAWDARETGSAGPPRPSGARPALRFANANEARVEITIGRLEIRGEPVAAPRPAKPFKPDMDLAAYRARHSERHSEK